MGPARAPGGERHGGGVEDERSGEEGDDEDGDEEEGRGGADPLEVVHLVDEQDAREPGSQPRPPCRGRGARQRQGRGRGSGRRHRALVAPRPGGAVEGAHGRSA